MEQPNLELQHSNLKQIVKRLAETEHWPDNKLPCNYLCLDTETTGVNTSTDSIVQIGLCEVRDCKPAHTFCDTDYTSFIVKLPPEKFFGKEGAIAVHGIDHQKSQKEGIEPKDAYCLLYDIVMKAKEQGLYVCGHNLYSFDIPFLQTELARMGITFKFAENEVIDTAMLVKAMQLGMLPGVGETSYAFWFRVRNFRAKGIYYSLDRYCIERFNLAAKYGVSKDSAHDAGYDCWMSHLLVAEMNHIVTS